MMEIAYFNKTIAFVNGPISANDAKTLITDKIGGNASDYYLLVNGKRVENNAFVQDYKVHIVPVLRGGKGGFGSMLRAIGAQIEKTTNREACRDLSGRRLRDINEEKRLKTWIAQQIDREKETVDKKQKKLEKLCQQPKYEFKDEKYEKDRADLSEKVEDAVVQGLKVAEEKHGQKRTAAETKRVKKKKPKLWVDADLDDLSSDDSEEDLEQPGSSQSAIS